MTRIFMTVTRKECGEPHQLNPDVITTEQKLIC